MSTVATITESLPSSLNLSGSGAKQEKEKEATAYKYEHLLPTFDASVKYPRLTPFKHEDPGHRALSHQDPTSFLKTATKTSDITPSLGTEIEGVNLATLTSDERDQLALLAARRGLLVFRGQQEFIDAGTDRYLEWGRHFGRLHIHPTSGAPVGVPEIHLVYRDKERGYDAQIDDKITTSIWHSDVSYELQPPGTTTFFLVDQRKSHYIFMRSLTHIGP